MGVKREDSWFGNFRIRAMDGKLQRRHVVVEATTPHICHRTGDVTKEHIAFKYLRTTNIGQKGIDENGNFVGSKHPGQSQDGGRAGSESCTDSSIGKHFMISCASAEFSNTSLPLERGWEEEFLQIEYRMDILPKWLLFCGLVVIQSIFIYAYGDKEHLPENCFKETHSWLRDPAYRAISQLPSLAVGIFSLLLGAVIKMKLIPAAEERVWYSTLVLAWVVSMHFALQYSSFVREVIRSSHGDISSMHPNAKCANTSHIQVTYDFNYSAFTLPIRTCVDHDQLKTVTQWPFLHSLGCESQVLNFACPAIMQSLPRALLVQTCTIFFFFNTNTDAPSGSHRCSTLHFRGIWKLCFCFLCFEPPGRRRFSVWR